MAKVICFLLCFSIVVLSVSTTTTSTAAARIINPPNSEEGDILAFVARNYRKVCDPTRFRGLGLDMKDFLYCNSSLTMDIRVKDLIDRMSLKEKVQQLGFDAKGVERLGLPKYFWWSEALHGVSNFGGGCYFDEIVPGATSFPTPIVMAAAFNEKLWKNIAQVVSTEARGMYNVGHAGMTFWTPNINVVRDPRWGRIVETSGEDPLVVGRYAMNHVRGLQDIHDGNERSRTRPLKVAACCKHYVAYDMDNWKGYTREAFNASVEERDMIETFQKPFEMCILDGDVASVMCSYNQVNGLPTCADAQLLKDTVRGKWDLNGYIVSDCDSVQVMREKQHFLGYSPEEDVAIVLRAGLDLDCGSYLTEHIPKATDQGKIRVSDVDNALKNLYFVLMRLGFFDGRPEFDNLGRDDVCTEANINLAIQAAREGMVLLKNDNQTLPFMVNEIKTLAVIGPHSNATKDMLGNYAGVPCKYTSPLDAFKKMVEVIHEMGCNNVTSGNDSRIFSAMEAAREADATVLIVGLSLAIEREGLDRVDLLLPDHQTKLINKVASVAKGAVILVIMSAGGVDISFAKTNPKITSIIWAGYAGEEGGRGIADIVFGKYNPSGRLPITWYENSYVNKLPMVSMSLRPVSDRPGRTYKFYDGPVVYPFGYGLSYTKFNYSDIESKPMLEVQLDKYTKCRDIDDQDAGGGSDTCSSVSIDDLSKKDGGDKDLMFHFSVEVKNTGVMDGAEAVLVYWVPPKGIVNGSPIKQLIGFQKVFLEAGKSSRLYFNFTINDFGLVDCEAYTVLAAGKHKIVLGDDVVSFALSVIFIRN